MRGYRYAVIGGGIAGLTAALALARAAGGANVVLLEASGRLGGVVSTERRDRYLIERGPDGVLSRKPETMELIRELGLEDRVIGRRAEFAGAFLRTSSGLRPFPAGLTGMVPLDFDSLRESGILSGQGLARAEMEPTIGGGGNDTAYGVVPEGDESVASFFCRRFGRELYERLVAPLVSGVYAGTGEELSMRALFPRLLELEREHGSVIEGMRVQQRDTRRSRSERAPNSAFFSLTGGMGELVDACHAELERLGVTIMTGRRALSIAARAGGGYEIATGSSGRRTDRGASQRNTGSNVPSVPAERVVAAISAPALADAVPAGAAEAERAALASDLRGIEMRSAALVTLALPDRALQALPPGAGYVVAGDSTAAESADSPSPSPSHELLACTVSSRKWSGRAPEGRALVRFYFRRNQEGAVGAGERCLLIEMAREELADVVSSSERRPGAGSTEVEPEFARVVVRREVSPVYRVGHLDRVAAIRRALADSLPGVSIAGSSYDGVGIPDCIASGRRAAAEALER